MLQPSLTTRTYSETDANSAADSSSQDQCDAIRFVHSSEFEAADADERILGSSVSPSTTLPKSKIPVDVPGHLRHLWEIPLLTVQQEPDLFRRMNYLKYRATQTLAQNGDPTASEISVADADLRAAQEVRDYIVQANMRLVVSLARRYQSNLMSLDDLISTGNLTLMKAVERFDYSRGFRFSTYATHSIRRDFFRAAGRRQKNQDREQPTPSEMLSDSLPSREAPVDGSDEALPPAELLHLVDRYLPARERMIVRKRYGLNEDGRSYTLRDLADEMGVSKERVRQLQMRAVNRLRQWIVDDSV